MLQFEFLLPDKLFWEGEPQLFFPVESQWNPEQNGNGDIQLEDFCIQNKWQSFKGTGI